MIVAVWGPRRPYADLSTITTKEISRRGWIDSDGDEHYEVQFVVNLTAAEQDQVVRRLSTGGEVEETLHARATAAYQDLLAFENLATPTNAQVVTVVRLLCKVARGLIRLQLRQFDTAD